MSNRSFAEQTQLLSYIVSHNNVSVKHHELYQDPETESDECNSTIISFIIYTCAFLTGLGRQ